MRGTLAQPGAQKRERARPRPEFKSTPPLPAAWPWASQETWPSPLPQLQAGVRARGWGTTAPRHAASRHTRSRSFAHMCGPGGGGGWAGRSPSGTRGGHRPPPTLRSPPRRPLLPDRSILYPDAPAAKVPREGRRRRPSRGEGAVQQGLDSRWEPPSPGSRAWTGLDEPRVGARPQSGCAGSTEGRKASWPPATLQPHNGVILPGHRMPFVAHQPAAQPRAGSGSEGAGGYITRPSAPLRSGRQAGHPQSLPPGGLRSNRHCPHQAAGAEAARTRPALWQLAARPAPDRRQAVPSLEHMETLLPTPGLALAVGQGRGPGGLARPAGLLQKDQGLPPTLTRLPAQQQPPSPAPQASPAHPTIMHPSARMALST